VYGVKITISKRRLKNAAASGRRSKTEDRGSRIENGGRRIERIEDRRPIALSSILNLLSPILLAVDCYSSGSNAVEADPRRASIPPSPSGV
jgi:hypothetical protein